MHRSLSLPKKKKIYIIVVPDYVNPLDCCINVVLLCIYQMEHVMLNMMEKHTHEFIRNQNG
jgi:hypothetical protein